jgi:hypothetical protein
MSFVPAIPLDIFALQPDFTALSLYVENVRSTESDARSTSLLHAGCEAPGAAAWAEAHLEAGATPTAPSAPNVRKWFARTGPPLASSR